MPPAYFDERYRAESVVSIHRLLLAVSIQTNYEVNSLSDNVCINIKIEPASWQSAKLSCPFLATRKKLNQKNDKRSKQAAGYNSKQGVKNHAEMAHFDKE